MVSQPTPIRIPLLGVSGKVGHIGPGEEVPPGLKLNSEVEINVSQALPERCYGLEIPDIIGKAGGTGRSLGIFGPGKDLMALNEIYALGLAGREPLVCKVIKNDAHSSSSNRGELSKAISPSRMKNRRKSFMTPTPLHIPESRVSPIPDSAHEMIYLKKLIGDEALEVVSLRDVVWMHPLISVMEKPPE